MYNVTAVCKAWRRVGLYCFFRNLSAILPCVTHPLQLFRLVSPRFPSCIEPSTGGHRCRLAIFIHPRPCITCSSKQCSSRSCSGRSREQAHLRMPSVQSNVSMMGSTGWKRPDSGLMECYVKRVCQETVSLRPGHHQVPSSLLALERTAGVTEPALVRPSIRSSAGQCTNK